MTYMTQNPDTVSNMNLEKKSEAHKCARWKPREKIFIAAVEYVTAEGHRQGKCFSSIRWDCLRDLFNKKVGKDWTIT
ncbi:Hypothetical predicted protein [Olea europaea subsp. europaea]|uniref:Myb/SANT-like domain-containing protein n=1 Tax=Olea europaea subsp. europaea TaxID=158383 RepID=A0A8S0SLL7_OLEEU|nr:Hypothetical predicted protein [Olea europaea subsp. europaea]